jgi:hypothetical protein
MANNTLNTGNYLFGLIDSNNTNHIGDSDLIFDNTIMSEKAETRSKLKKYFKINKEQYTDPDFIDNISEKFQLINNAHSGKKISKFTKNLEMFDVESSIKQKQIDIIP